MLIDPADDAPGLLRLLDSLERRGSTLRRCAEAALEAQRPFFSGQTGDLAPMTLSSLAESLALHPSTVSRAVRGKYLQCRQGTYPLRYFFSLPVSGGVSRQAAKQALLSLVREEDRNQVPFGAGPGVLGGPAEIKQPKPRRPRRRGFASLQTLT